MGIVLPAAPVPGPTLETARLVLRPPCADDFEPWAGFMADERSARYLGGVQPRAVAWRALAAMIGAWHLRGFSMFSVIEKASGRWIGRLGPWQPEEWPGTEVGWGIVRDAEGRGYATEGSTAAIDWAFDALGWREVIHTIQPGNEPSKAVARKLGSRYLRMDRLPAPHGFEVEVWGQDRGEWMARRAGRNG
ncbi:GNAT family N-acetyltransferase [Pseudoxanthomonas sangjuensis]|uniref:GNAT family N-acetyltransferase n=1 Tax=Pseudoxanthomonas sangjuensis TaxID=1503750 RepID=UPI0013910DDF|nr:GNAT family N-acetyltransferase [Pseudoxanthomonas sangjuensis]KAF1713295.1 GNAT family N-acetyltransferase [Pseudoxanthomonas sangjuensis]